MDYEQKYKEALERAKKLKHDVETIGCSMAPDTIEIIFPELEESEDERIRKEIISFFEQFTNEELRGVNISDWIDWLKKRKEQQPTNSEKPKEWSEEDVEKLAKNRARKSGTLKSEMIFYRQGVRDAFDYKGMCPRWKPSEEQMKALSWAINYLTGIENGCASTLALLKFDLKSL